MSPPPTVFQIFFAALRLGCTSFGGPVAHLGYFQRDYVERRRWLSPEDYAELVALCQFLPGPASSQTGFGIGYLLRGWSGGVAAWVGFTLPSALLMIGFALGLTQLGDAAAGGWVRGLKIAAVAIVAHAVLAMWRSLAPDALRSAFVLASAGALLLWPASWLQVGVIAVGGLAGLAVLRGSLPAPVANAGATPGWRRLAVLLGIFFALLVGLPTLARMNDATAVTLADTFYRAGALVFGGGHVVLPLLERELVAPGGVTADQFLAGYGAAQAMPGPLFTFAGYLGATQAGAAGGAWALLWVFLPGLLLVPAVLPLWRAVRGIAAAQAALRGANAAVVGLLLAALIDPVARVAVTDLPSGALAVAGFAALQGSKFPAWALVLACAVTGGLLF